MDCDTEKIKSLSVIITKTLTLKHVQHATQTLKISSNQFYSWFFVHFYCRLKDTRQMFAHCYKSSQLGEVIHTIHVWDFLLYSIVLSYSVKTVLKQLEQHKKIVHVKFILFKYLNCVRVFLFGEFDTISLLLHTYTQNWDTICQTISGMKRV